jgi:hypothetical protein
MVVVKGRRCEAFAPALTWVFIPLDGTGISETEDWRKGLDL